MGLGHQNYPKAPLQPIDIGKVSRLFVEGLEPVTLLCDNVTAIWSVNHDQSQ